MKIEKFSEKFSEKTQKVEERYDENILVETLQKAVEFAKTVKLSNTDLVFLRRYLRELNDLIDEM